MAIKIVTSWHSLFHYAGRVGEARTALKESPTKENEEALAAAIREHDDYRDICLSSDEMIGLDLADL